MKRGRTIFSGATLILSLFEERERERENWRIAQEGEKGDFDMQECFFILFLFNIII